MTKKVVGLITIFIVSLSAMGAWDSKLIGTEQLGGICLNYANNTIQNPRSNLGVTGSTGFTRCMTGVSPYVSTYDNWDVTPLIVVK